MQNFQFSIFNQKGSALIIVLLIVTILTSLTVEFAYEVYIGTSALSNWQNAQKASLLSMSGQTIGMNYIKDLKARPYTSEREAEVPVEKIPKQIRTEEKSVLTIKVIDENSKFNINSIIYPNGLTNERALSSLKKLMEYLNINPSLSVYIADWIDPDSEPRLMNAEYMAKNSYLWSIDELRLINGIDKKTFDTIKPFITIYGSNMVNINTAELPVLVCLHERMTEYLAKKIIDYRDGAPFEERSHITRVSGLEDIGIQMQDIITVKSSDFRVISNASVSEITRIIESVMDESMTIRYWMEG